MNRGDFFKTIGGFFASVFSGSAKTSYPSNYVTFTTVGTGNIVGTISASSEGIIRKDY